MGMHEYLKSLSDLEMINRAPGYFKFEEHNVAAQIGRASCRERVFTGV